MKSNRYTILILLLSCVICIVLSQCSRPSWNEILLVGRGEDKIENPIDKFWLWCSMEYDGYTSYSYDEFIEQLKSESYQHYCYDILMLKEYHTVLDIDLIRNYSPLESIEKGFWDWPPKFPKDLTFSEFTTHLFNEADLLITELDKDKVISLYNTLYYSIEPCTLQEFADKMKDPLYIKGIYSTLKREVNRFTFPLSPSQMYEDLTEDDQLERFKREDLKSKIKNEIIPRIIGAVLLIAWCVFGIYALIESKEEKKITRVLYGIPTVVSIIGAIWLFIKIVIL